MLSAVAVGWRAHGHLLFLPSAVHAVNALDEARIFLRGVKLLRPDKAEDRGREIAAVRLTRAVGK